MPDKKKPRVTVAYVTGRLRDGAKIVVSSFGTYVYTPRPRDSDAPNNSRTISRAISRAVFEKLQEKKIIVPDEDLNRLENPYEDHHDLHYKLAE